MQYAPVAIAIPRRRPMLTAGVSISITGSLVALLACLLLGYWSFGKAFAYVGFFPIYISEIGLCLGVVLVALFGRLYFLRHTSFVLWLALLGGCITQAAISIVVLGQSPIEVLRNVAVIYYSMFAYLTYAVIRQTSGSRDLLSEIYYRLPGWSFWVLLIITASMCTTLYYWGSVPMFPGTDVTVLFYKPTDASMPLVILIGFWLLRRVSLRYGLWALVLMLASAARNRSAMLALAVTLLFLWRPNRRGLTMAAVLFLLASIFVIGDFRINLGGYRELSARQFVENISSLVGSEKESTDGTTTTAVTKSWRMAWWEAILKDASSSNRVLMGSGWGSNLADMFGFQTAYAGGTNVLRHPHNALLGILARAGWVVAFIWVAFYLTLIGGLLRSLRLLRSRPVLRNLSILSAIYLISCLIHGATDVFLEAPQNAIPHWIMVGIAWALIAEAKRKTIWGYQEHVELTRAAF
jgi:hypothetical protein